LDSNRQEWYSDRIWHIGVFHDRIRVLFRELHHHVIRRSCRLRVMVVLLRILLWGAFEGVLESESNDKSDENSEAL